MLSFWEKQSLLNYDIIIIGSGIVGLSTAIAIKERNATKRVMVLERGILPTGASTKNAGFACIGSLTEILDDLEGMSEDEVLQLVELRLQGLAILRKRLGDDNIAYAESGSHELIGENEEKQVNEIDRINELLKPVLKGNAFSLSNHQINKFGFSLSYVKHLVANNYEGELHTGKMMRALVDMCLQTGVEIKTGSEVLKIEEEAGGVQVVVNNTFGGEEITFNAQQTVICTNAFSRRFYPEMDLQPGRGLVLVTKPVEGLKFKGIFHFDKGYYYFRRIGDRVMLGGGRNMDIAGERTTEFAVNETIYNSLVEKLKTVIIPGINFEVEQRWTGIMAFGATKMPVIMQQSPRVYVGVRMGGMGIAIGSKAAEQLANLVLTA